MDRSRRSILSIGAGSIATAVAGCLSESDLQGSEGGYAAFFTLQDWANAVGGDHITFETPIDVGDMGHGWSPSSDLITELGTSRVFIYLDSPAFSWAQDAADVIERDYDDVTLVDALDGLDLLATDHEITHDDGHHEDGEHDHDEGDDHHEDGEQDHDEGDDHHEDGEHDHDEGDDHHEDGEHDHDEGDDHADEHDHGQYDPHAWVDPVRATQMVETIADGLARVEPDHEDSFRENAAAYTDQLDDLDRQFRTLVSDIGGPIGVLASHDSFRYLQDRYGFVLHTPAGISPDQSPSQSEIAETIDFVDSNGIETVLYDRFESDRLARTIVENSDATSTEAISPAAGTTETWAENGWGYVEQMAEINVPALEAALVSRD
ncbi:ABC-type metal ion transport system, periplasmic component/surface adhesin [Halovivax ruber XH-70]|uniref:ABC-type metal ion transport system, periplasmic component/surface adhesin n=1 Tax=Halovivax ruber (strain DSM 18193 / JCM 13892 / XH-70) TaxID=797302 RepID=L0IBI3_HALRX|nr:zinc ABC transporter substrate-binding protein [Halovivax ruber]AGB16124.1 ABC-type metal ion transport system, periplasmic component/surface adhesin [Halovivax ruber XH-70]